MDLDDSGPCYVISVAAQMIGVHAQTLRYYEKLGLVEPTRSKGRRRLYSPRDLARLRHIKALMEELGVNLAGVEIVLRMAERIAALEQELKAMEDRLASIPAQPFSELEEDS